LLGATAVAWPVAARAQQPTVPVIGYLYSGAPETSAYLTTAFRIRANAWITLSSSTSVTCSASQTHLSLNKDCPRPRCLQPPFRRQYYCLHRGRLSASSL